MNLEAYQESIRTGSDQATAPIDMQPVPFPKGTLVVERGETRVGVGAIELLHGRIRTFASGPEDYVNGSLILFNVREIRNSVEVHVARRGLTGEEINLVGKIAEKLLSTQHQLGIMRGMLFNAQFAGFPEPEDVKRSFESLEQKRASLIKDADKLGVVLMTNPLVAGNGYFMPIRLQAERLSVNPVDEDTLLKQMLCERMETRGNIKDSKHPFVEALKSRFTWQNAQEKIFGGNAYPGHAIAAALGMVPALADYYFKLKSEPTVLTLAPVAVLVASLLIPYQGYDKMRERWQAHVITFGPMFTLGTTAGGLLATRALETAEEIAGSNLPDALLTASNTLGLVGAASVIMAYITVGFMSRRERWDYLSRFNLPESITRIDTTLLMRKAHMLADRLHVAIGTNNLEDAVALLEELKENAYDESEMTLDEVKRRVTVDRLQNILDYKKNRVGLKEFLATFGEIHGRIDRLSDALDNKKKKIALRKALIMLRDLTEHISPEEIREQIIYGQGSINRNDGLPRWLLEQAEEELVEWHYTPSKAEKQAPRPKRRGLFHS